MQFIPVLSVTKHRLRIVCKFWVMLTLEMPDCVDLSVSTHLIILHNLFKIRNSKVNRALGMSDCLHLAFNTAITLHQLCRTLDNPLIGMPEYVDSLASNPRVTLQLLRKNNKALGMPGRMSSSAQSPTSATQNIQRSSARNARLRGLLTFSKQITIQQPPFNCFARHEQSSTRSAHLHRLFIPASKSPYHNHPYHSIASRDVQQSSLRSA